jgi:hypothetical protein
MVFVFFYSVANKHYSIPNIRLSDCSNHMCQCLQGEQTTTSEVLTITEQIQKKEVTGEAHKEVVQAFLVRFRLKSNEVVVLISEGEIHVCPLRLLCRTVSNEDGVQNPALS